MTSFHSKYHLFLQIQYKKNVESYHKFISKPDSNIQGKILDFQDSSAFFSMKLKQVKPEISNYYAKMRARIEEPL